MPDFPGAILNPNSGESILNMKGLIADEHEFARRRHSNNSDFDKALNQLHLEKVADTQTLKYIATINSLTADQTGQTENQQDVSPIGQATAEAIKGTVGVSAADISASIAKLADALVSIITATGGVVSAETVASLLPVVVTAAGGASTPSQTQAKPTA